MMGVLASCLACESTHPLGERPAAGPTTSCPSCGSVGYESSATEVDVDEERERIRDIVECVDGVGDQTAASIAERMVTVDRLRNVRIRELKEIPGVGEKNVRGIVQAARGVQ